MPEDPGSLEPRTRVSRVGMVARWKPVHLGHAEVLRGLTDAAELAVIGIGSSNRYDAHNPFTPDETARMIRLALAGRANYRILEVPDLGHGPRWRAMVAELFGPLDVFVTANPYVRDLMADIYPVAHPASFVPPDRRVRVDGTLVRRRMAEGGAWDALVPDAVATYLRDSELVSRFVREFGYETVASDAPGA